MSGDGNIAGASVLAILERSFRLLDLPARASPGCPNCGTACCGIYLLVEREEVVYVGSSVDICNRLYHHKREHKEFDRVLWYPLPSKVLRIYEGAFMRYLNPRDNIATPPKGDRFDLEIIDGFGLDPAQRLPSNEIAEERRRQMKQEQGDHMRRVGIWKKKP